MEIFRKRRIYCIFLSPFIVWCTNLRVLITCETMKLAFISEIFRKCTSFFSSNAGLFVSCFSQSSHYQSIMSKKIFANDFLHLRISHSCEKWCQKWRFLRHKYSVFSQMMQMKTPKKRFAKIIRHGRLMAKIDNMLIISTLAIFRFFANVLGQKDKDGYTYKTMKL